MKAVFDLVYGLVFNLELDLVFDIIFGLAFDLVVFVKITCTKLRVILFHEICMLFICGPFIIWLCLMLLHNYK